MASSTSTPGGTTRRYERLEHDDGEDRDGEEEAELDGHRHALRAAAEDDGAGEPHHADQKRERDERRDREENEGRRARREREARAHRGLHTIVEQRTAEEERR